MRKGRIMFVPVGGLANRMMATASAYTLAKRIDSTLQILWFQDWALSAPFTSIFKASEIINVKDASFTDKLLYDRARKKNLWLPSLPQKLLFERRMEENHLFNMNHQHFDFDQWAQGYHCHMSGFCQFEEYPDDLYRKLFKPVDEVMEGVNRNREQFSSHTIGLHIRRTDHVQAIANSPDQLFIEQVEKEIEQYADTKVFLATDNNQVKDTFRKHFGNRIITPTEEARRDSINGIRGGLVDMYTLASTCQIYGSAGSTFSPMAARIGGCAIEILSSKKI